MLNFISEQIISRLTTKQLLVLLVFVVMGCWYYYDYLVLKYEVEHAPTNQEVLDAKVSHSFEIIKFHLQYLTDDEMKDTVEKWASENWRWGAQIAAIRNVCKNDPDRLAKLMYREDVVYLCRLVN